MNLPPAQPPPMSMPPPPPPPPKKSSGALKWILIGCGGVAFIGLIICGGCVVWGISITKSLLKVQEEVTTLLRNNPEVQEELGDVEEVEPEGDAKGKSGTDVVLRYIVK